MLKYFQQYESISAQRLRILKLTLGLHVTLLKVMLIVVKLALFFPGLK